MANYNKKTLFENISYLLAEKGIRVGELEREAGVSKGYIAHTRDTDNKPSIDFVLRVADKLEVSIDVLLGTNLSTLTPSDEYLLQFVQKLISDTVEDKLNWKTESAEVLNSLENSDPAFPLFSRESYTEMHAPDEGEHIERVEFVSKSFGVNTWIAGDCFRLELPDGVDLFLMDICKAYHKAKDPGVYAKEVWFALDAEHKQFLCANNDGSQLERFVNDLFTVVAGNARHPKLKEPFKQAMEAFMNSESD